MLCLAGKLGLMDWTLVPGLCTAGGRPLREWALGSGRSPGLWPLLLSRSRSASVLHLPVGGCLSVCPPSLKPGRRVISRGRAVWPAGLRATSRRHAALSQPGSTLGPWPSGHRPPGAAAGGWLAACAGSPGERGPAATIKAERGRDRDRDGGGTGRGSSCRPGLGCGGSAGGPSLGPPRCLSLQLALTHRGGCVSAQVAQALPAGTWVSHGEGPPGQRGPGSSSAQPGQEGRRPPPESSAAPSAAPAAQTLRPAPVTPSSLLSSRLSGAPLFPWVSGRPQGFLFVPAHPDLHTAVEDGGPASPGRFRHQGQAGGRPGRPPAGLQWAPSRPLLHSLSQTLPPRNPRPAQWSEPPRERPRQAPARPGPRRPPAGLQEPAVNSWWLRPPYSDSTDPRG